QPLLDLCNKLILAQLKRTFWHLPYLSCDEQRSIDTRDMYRSIDTLATILALLLRKVFLFRILYAIAHNQPASTQGIAYPNLLLMLDAGGHRKKLLNKDDASESMHKACYYHGIAQNVTHYLEIIPNISIYYICVDDMILNFAAVKSKNPLYMILTIIGFADALMSDKFTHAHFKRLQHILPNNKFYMWETNHPLFHSIFFAQIFGFDLLESLYYFTLFNILLIFASVFHMYIDLEIPYLVFIFRHVNNNFVLLLYHLPPHILVVWTQSPYLHLSTLLNPLFEHN
ncbi:hypothetical protein ACJX0J_033029, partial [Zea mays]